METMRTISVICRQTTTACLAVGGVLFWAASAAAQSDTLTFTNASPRSAAAMVNQRYGVTVVFKSVVNAGRSVSFSVDNPDTPVGRLQTINNLANAVGMDFQKVFVVSKIDAGAAVPDVKIDNDGPIVFTSVRMPAREAVQTVAAVDNALVQISDAVTGTVTFPSTHISAASAATIIARQTGTTWKTYYGLYRRGETPPRFGGTVVDRTTGGQAIMQLPLLTFRDPGSRTVPLYSGDTAVVGPFEQPSSDPSVASVPGASTDAFPDMGFGAYGFNPYGNSYNPYGYGGPGYLTPNGTTAVPGSVYTPGSGTTPVVPGYNAPGATGVVNSGGMTTTAP